jgi:hypothetical protein
MKIVTAQALLVKKHGETSYPVASPVEHEGAAATGYPVILNYYAAAIGFVYCSRVALQRFITV